MKKNDETPIEVTIREAATMLGVGQPFVRVLLRKGTLTSRLTPIYEGARVKKHLILVSSLVGYMNRERLGAGPRPDGRNKYVLYLKVGESEVLRDFIEANLPGVSLTRANPPKSREDDEGGAE